MYIIAIWWTYFFVFVFFFLIFCIMLRFGFYNFDHYDCFPRYIYILYLFDYAWSAMNFQQKINFLYLSTHILCANPSLIAYHTYTQLCIRFCVFCNSLCQFTSNRLCLHSIFLFLFHSKFQFFCSISVIGTKYW